MLKFRKVVIALVALVIAFSPLTNLAYAARSFISGAKVVELRTYGAGNFGSCVAQINKNVNTDGDAALSCGNARLVSFACDGAKTNSKSEANQMFSNAQLAMVTEASVDIYVNDAQKYGTMCVAEFLYVR